MFVEQFTDGQYSRLKKKHVSMASLTFTEVQLPISMVTCLV